MAEPAGRHAGRPVTGREHPVSTYRLQLRDEFGFGRAAEQAGYLAALGVTHVYLSPIRFRPPRAGRPRKNRRRRNTACSARSLISVRT